MREAIAKLRKSIAFQKGLENNLLGAQSKGLYGNNENDDDDDKKKKAKRVAVKKEKADFDNNKYDGKNNFHIFK
jgi:hypothetical protein